jgi:predicted glycosyltransferase
MQILLDITHPADVHFFLRPMQNWRAAGHTVVVVARDKDIVLPLLAELKVECLPIGRAGRGPVGLAVELLQREVRLLRLMRDRRPDVVCGFGGTFVVHPAWLLGVPRVVFTDTENARVANALAFPFASLVCTPRAYPHRLRRPQFRYSGYKELAYLHPRHFTPDPAALRDAGLSEAEPFVFMRLVAWGSGHDFFDHGLSDVRAAVERLSRFGRVVVSAEGPLPAELEPLRLRGPLHRVHHLLAFARLYIGESATMGAESAVLGTPAVVVSTSRRSYLDELTARYGLAFCYDHPRWGQAQALQQAEALLGDPQTAQLWREGRARMLAEQEDVSQFVTDLVVRQGREV